MCIDAMPGAHGHIFRRHRFVRGHDGHITAHYIGVRAQPFNDLIIIIIIVYY